MGFTGGAGGKEPACQCSTQQMWDLISGSERSSGGGHGNPLQYPCLENPHGQRSPVGCSPWGCRVGHGWNNLAHSTQCSRGLPTVVSLRVCERAGWGERERWRELVLLCMSVGGIVYLYAVNCSKAQEWFFFFTFFFSLSRIPLSLFSFASYYWLCSQVISWAWESPIFSLKP